MAFTGTPVVKRIGDSLYRLTGVSLAAGAAGTLGLPGSAAMGADPEAPFVGCDWGPYQGPGELITLDESMQVLINPVTDVEAFGVPIRVVKAANGLITLTNDSAATASASLEIYVRYH